MTNFKSSRFIGMIGIFVFALPAMVRAEPLVVDSQPYQDRLKKLQEPVSLTELTGKLGDLDFTVEVERSQFEDYGRIGLGRYRLFLSEDKVWKSTFTDHCPPGKYCYFFREGASDHRVPLTTANAKQLSCIGKQTRALAKALSAPDRTSFLKELGIQKVELQVQDSDQLVADDAKLEIKGDLLTLQAVTHPVLGVNSCKILSASKISAMIDEMSSKYRGENPARQAAKRLLEITSDISKKLISPGATESLSTGNQAKSLSVPDLGADAASSSSDLGAVYRGD